MKFLKAILIGIPISFLGIWPFVGDVVVAAALFVVSIVCTAGISLVVWVPVWWLLGRGVLAVWSRITGNAGQDAASAQRKLTRDCQAVMNYLAETRRAGIDDETAIGSLRAKGWPDDLIGQARKTLP